MNLDDFPRTRLASVPTPIEHLPRLGSVLGGPQVFIKRDDYTGLAMGGNKVRQIEFHVGAALAEGADTLITTGAVQSNHARVTAAAARRVGMRCVLQREDRVADMPECYHESGNVLLADLLDAEVVAFPVGEDEAAADDALDELAEQVRSDGGAPYVIGLGVDRVPLGALGYVVAAAEVVAQQRELGVSFDTVVLPSGSANTHAGLLVGLRTLGSRAKVVGFCVRRDRARQEARVREKVRRTCELIGQPLPPDDDIRVDDSQLGPGYGQLTPEVLEAIRTTAATEAVLLDPVYTGKTMAGLFAWVRECRFASTDNVLFLHTGGLPALFAYGPMLMKR